MISKALETITAADLQRLIDDEVAESKFIDYKRQLPPDTREGHREFLKDVSALANTDGGDLLYGVEEEGGVPTALPGLQIANQDALVQQLENRLRDGIQPRLTDVRFRFVLVPHGIVLIIRAAKSWSAPHRVTAGGHGHFYARNSNETYFLDVEQLRDAYMRAQAVEDRIRQFRAERILAISAGEIPVPIIAGAIYVIHIVPLSAFTGRELVPMALLRNNLGAFVYFDSSGYSQRTNLDGMVVFETRRGTNTFYTQAYRNGCVEAAVVFEPRNDGVHVEQRGVPVGWCEWQTLQAVNSYTRALPALGIAPPLYLFISLVNGAGYSLWAENWLGNNGAPLDRNTLLLPEAVIEATDTKPGAALKHVFDMLWHAFDYPGGTPNLNPAGDWVGKR